jgi:glycosyltransferase involved in cell wall biosynthesis
MTFSPPGRVVHAAENIKGGVGTYLRDLLVAQRASFGDGVVIAVVPETQSGILESPAGVEIVTFDNRGPRWLSTLRLARRMREVMARADASVVHLHSTFAGLALRPLLRWMRTELSSPPVVYCAHGWSFDRETSAISKRIAIWLEKALAPLCDAIVCISWHEMWLARTAGISSEKLFHISNGVPREAPVPSPRPPEPQWPAGKRRVLFVGRFDRQKGLDIVAEAVAELGDSVFAYLVGDSVLGDGEPLRLPENARATGWLTAAELTSYYESADVLVAPSRWEGFGLIAAEAMRAGLPVIATRVGGLAEIVEHGVTGLLIEPGSRQALVNAMRALELRSPKLMGEAGRQRFLRHYTLDRAHAQLSALYSLVCAQGSAESGQPCTDTTAIAGTAGAAQAEGSTNA